MLYRKLQAEGLSSLQVCVPSLLTLLFILFHFDLVDLWFKISENLSFQLPVYIKTKMYKHKAGNMRNESVKNC